MGMFDSVMVPCPKCHKDIEFQSKSGECLLDVYTLDTVPMAVLGDINRHSPYDCPKCGTPTYVKVTVVATSAIYERGIDKDGDDANIRF